MRKNKIEGAINGAGRPKKNLIGKHLNLTKEAVEVLNKLKFGESGEFVSNAILLAARHESCGIKQEKL